MTDLFETGLKQRKATLGADYVENNLAAADEFTRPFQEAMTEWCWGFGWGDDVIDPKTRSMMNLAMIGALGKMTEWEIHCRGALNNGVTKDEIRAAVGDGSQFGAKVTYIEQSAPLGLAHAVLTAEEFLGDDSFVMYLGDNLIAGGITSLVDEFKELGCNAQILLAEVPNPQQFGVAELTSGDVRARRCVDEPEMVRVARKPRDDHRDARVDQRILAHGLLAVDGQPCMGVPRQRLVKAEHDLQRRDLVGRDVGPQGT